jgi:hypothetical protein
MTTLEFDFSEQPEDKREKGYKCNCCGQFVKLYRRTFNCNMGLALMVLYKFREQGFIHLEKKLSELGYQRCGDASYLRHYRLIEGLSEEREDGSPRNGMYRITGLGIMFAENKSTVKQHFHTFNNRCEKFSGKEVGIIDVLTVKFNYNQLMDGAN